MGKRKFTNHGIPEGAFEGLRAMIIQSYVESNVKLGLQYEIGFYNPALAAEATVYFILQTGNNPIVLKGRRLEFDGLGIQSTVFENPTFTGGDAAPIYNLNHKNPVVGEVVLLTSPSVTDEGTQVQATKTFLGASLNGNQIQVETGQEAGGIEYIYAPNTAYLFKVESIDSSDTQRLSSYATFYEGGLDLPLVN